MFLKNIFEAMTRTGEGKTAVIGWGRGMGHKGHMYLASSVISKAKEVNGDPYFVVSRTVGKDDPITPEEKLAIYKKVFPQQGHIFQAASDEIPDLTRVLTNLNQQGYTDAIVVVGADQVKAFQYLKNYNGKPDKSGNIPFQFNSLNVIARQETNDPSAGEEGPRATPMRAVLMDPTKSEEEKFAVWRDAMNPELSDDEVRDLMHKAEQRMKAMAKPKKGVAEQDSPAMAHMAKSLENPPKIMQHRAKRDQERERQYMGTQIAKRDTTSKDEWGNLKQEEAAGVGVIASKKQAKDPRYSMSLTKDVRPGQVAKNLKAFSLEEGTNDKQYHGWEEYEEDKSAQVAEFLYDMQPDLFSRHGDEYLMNVIQQVCHKNPQASVTQSAGAVIRQLKNGIDEARMSAAVKLQRAWEREQLKSAASAKRGREYMSQIKQDVADKEKKKEQGVAEMDSQGYTGSRDRKRTSKYGSRDDYELGGPETTLGPDSIAKPKDVAKKGADALNRAMSNAHKKKGVAEKMLPKSAFAGSDKNKLGPAAHLKGSMKRPAQAGDLVGGAEESIEKEEKQRLDPKCWKGYRKAGTKMKGGVRVNNCVPVSESVENIMDNLINKIVENEAIQNNRR